MDSFKLVKMESEGKDGEGRGKIFKMSVRDSRIPDYAVRKKLQTEKLRGRAEMRALRYKERLKEGKKNKLTRLGWEEILKRADMKDRVARRKEENF